MTPAPRPRPGRLAIAVAGVWLLLAPAAVGGGMLLAPLQALAGLIAATTRAVRLRWRDWTPAVPLALFVVWVAVTAAWSPVHRPEQAAKIGAAAATGLALIVGIARADGPDRRLVRAGLAAALIVLCVYSAIEAAFDMPLNRLDEPDTERGILERNPGKGVSILVALVWAGAGALMTGPWRTGLAVTLLAATAALSLQFHMAANAVGFAAGLAAFALGWAAPRLAPLLLSGALAGWAMVAPWLSPVLSRMFDNEAMPMSWRMRGEIWRFAAARVAEKPWTGWGLDSSRVYGDTILAIGDHRFQAIPLHPHSVSMHIWLETGAAGAALFAVTLVAGGLAASRAFAAHRAAAAATCGAMASVGLIWNVSYGAWQEWWLAAVFLAFAASAALRRAPV
jgi:O-antigen ligase